MATKPIRAVGDVPGLQIALDNKLSLSGGTLTGQVSSTQSNTVPRFSLVNDGTATLPDHAAIYVRNNSTGYGVGVSNAAAGYGIHVSNSSTGRGINLTNTSTGIGIRGSNSSSGIGAAFYNTNTSGIALYVNTSSGNGLSVQTTSTDASKNGVYVLDNASTNATNLQVAHYGQGYGLDIANYAGSNSAFVVHQYSQAGNAAVWLDNCGTAPIIHMRNTENQSLAPGQLGTGKFLMLERKATQGGALAECFYISGEGVICAVPKASAPSTLADGMVWVEGAGASMALKVRLNGATKTVTVS